MKALNPLILLSLPAFLIAEEAIHPREIEFKRQAVKRMVFDEDQAIPLCSLHPANVHELDVMHPELLDEGDGGAATDWKVKGGKLVGSSEEAGTRSMRWVGGFNAFATYDLSISSLDGSGVVGSAFKDSSSNDLIEARVRFAGGSPEAIELKLMVNGAETIEEQWPFPDGISGNDFVLRVQMAVVGVNVLIEQNSRSFLVGYADFSDHIDIREKRLMQHWDFGVKTQLEQASSVILDRVSGAFTPGTGQADIRAITNPEGEPWFGEDRLWFTMTVRGRGLANPMQAVFSLNPSVFDLRFEGIIAFDLGDGRLRNEHASHLFYDAESDEWRGWTTGFSVYGGDGGHEAKTILAVSSTRDPRKGFCVMQAKPVGIDGAHEDPHCIFDREAGKWRMLLCEKHEKYRAAMWESDHWDGGFKRIAGPVSMDSTGTMIQKIGGARYALYGSADRTIYIATYPNLEPAGELQVYLPPWNEGNGTRVWPNVIPLPQGYPAPYLSLMMDRVNFPGMPKPNWTYGALYLYYGWPKGSL
ncbi:MAG: hypothetical protein AAGA96_16200 [Verrucomicrobiota bacterium]